MTRAMTTFVLLMGLFLGRLVAQDAHIQAYVYFQGTPSGDFAAIVTLNNASTNNSGVGTVDDLNGVPSNIPLTWSRDANGVVSIVVDGMLVGVIDCPVGATEGEAILNDGSNNGEGSPGGWVRIN